MWLYVKELNHKGGPEFEEVVGRKEVKGPLEIV